MKQRIAFRRRRQIMAAGVLATMLLAGACASAMPRDRADAHAMNGEWDLAITYYRQRLNEDPGDQETRRKLLLAQTNAAAFHRSQGVKLLEAGDLQNAELEVLLAVGLDPTNQAARIALRRVKDAIADKRARDAEEKTSIEMAIDRVDRAPSPIPELEHHATGQMTFDYRRARIKEIYRAMSRLGEVNVMFDPDLDNEPTSFFLARVDYMKAWEVLTATQGHFYRVMSPNTILVAPDNQPKRRQYEPQLMRTFYLSNANPEEVANALQTILQARQVVPIASLNAVTIRDTASVVEVASRMVRSLDKSLGEVLLQIEIFEVDRGVMDEWGLSLADNYTTTLSIAQGDSGISLADLGNITNQDVFITIPSLKYQFLKQSANFKLIAQPQLRASDGQLSQLLVGEQRPVVTTTFNPQSTVGGNVVPVSSTEYRDVGILIAATPRVHHDGSITLQLDIQVTAVQENEVGAENQPIFTARTLQTTLRLEEGETNLLAGLLRDDERQVRTGFPIISSIPVLRDLFGKMTTEITQTDIVLSITPYVVRMADITEEDLEAVYVGTEANMSGGVGGRRGSRSNRGGSTDEDDDEGGAPEIPPISVDLMPAEQSASVGQRITIAVQASGEGEVNNAGLRLNYDPQVLRLVDVREGAMLSGDGAETSFQSSGGAAGSVAIGIGRVGDVGGVMASGTLLTLEFEAIGAGESSIQIASAVLRDPQGRPLPVKFSRALVQVSGD